MDVMSLLNLPMVIAALQFGAGYILKKWPAYPNKIIPVATYVLALLGFTLAPKDVNAAGLLDPLMGGGSIFLAALAQNIAITGVHSTMKNTVRPALKMALGGLLGRWIKT